VHNKDCVGEEHRVTTVGQIEKKTQARVVALFRDTLGYTYLGDWRDRDKTATSSRRCSAPG